MAHRIVIAGGGFGGFYAARTLERVLPRHAARITLVNDLNFLLYTPLLPGAAGGTLEPRHVVVSLRQELRDTDLRIGHVIEADPSARRVRVRAPGRAVQELEYDHLVVAVGSVSRTLPVPGLAEYAIGFKSLPDAVALRNRLLSSLETAEGLDDPRERTEYLTWVFVGGGYAGLEGLAELQHYAARVLDLYPRCRLQGLRFVLVEAKERVMSEVPPELAAFAARELRGRGVEILTDTTLEELTERTARLSTGETVRTRHVVWTTGVKPHPSVQRLGLPLDGAGRIRTEKTLRVEGHDRVWAIGDAAAVPDPARPGQPCPPTAQHAMRQGRLVARNVAAALDAGDRIRPFSYRTLGLFVDLGRHSAVASAMGVRIRGFPAWFLARTYHLGQLPGTRRKLRLLLDWTVDLVAAREASELGQLGHPVPLDEEQHDQAASQPSAPAGGDGQRGLERTRSR